MDTPAALRDEIMDLVRRYHAAAHASKPFVSGKSAVPVSGKVYGAEEMQLLVDSALDFWLTAGRFTDAFEAKIAPILGARHVLTVNSGSSANLLALTALTSPLLKDRALRPGDEVITCATGFPTTLNPILQNGLVPVFLDAEMPTYNMDMRHLEEAITPRTRAIMLAHTLGNPFDLDTVMRVAQKHNLHVIEDCCDALGARYNGKPVGTFGAFGTLSFYPAHHITMGEGGAVFTSNSILKRAAESLRDWGRDCWCATGCDNTCGKRFEWQLGKLPAGYDHKYTYSHLGYNLKATDMQAAIGLAQLERLPGFIAARTENFKRLTAIFRQWENVFVLPEATPDSEPSWFGYCLTLREDAPFSREALVKFFNSKRIATRLLFGGNLLHQPYMQDRPHRVVGSLATSNHIMRQTFWLGVYPGLEQAHMDYIGEQMAVFMADASLWEAAVAA